MKLEAVPGLEELLRRMSSQIKKLEAGLGKTSAQADLEVLLGELF
jgi:hypothetical protein